MHRSLRPAFIALLILALTPGAATAADGCVTAPSSDRAATALYGAGTEVASRGTIAGLSTALALEPRIAPGTRRRMVQAGGGRWCDATTGFNEAFDGTPRDAAAAYARLAAAPYFDEVTVRDLRETAPGIFAVRTHARTNGIEAAWVIAADATGVRTATWKATAFAVKPFRAQTEGLTALPGLTESYDRVAAAELRPRTGLPTAESARAAAAPGDLLTYTSPDGFRIDISAGDTRVAPDLGTDTGIGPIDALRLTHATVAENFEEFYAWGLRSGWNPSDKGYVYVNDALSLACFACVFIADEFQIHISSEVLTILEALGYSYPADKRREAYSNVIGHEMFHNFQNRYVKPGPIVSTTRKNTSTAYAEGTARFQETLHDYAHASHQPGSLVYAQDLNGCNGYESGYDDMDEGMAAGPFNGRAYESCWFWTAWYGQNGLGDFHDLVTTTMPAAAAERNQHVEGVAATEGATGKSFTTQLAEFARSALTGTGYRWSAITTGESFDWAEHLERWEPKPLRRGESTTRTLSDGGVIGHLLPAATAVTLDAPAGARLVAIRESRGGAEIRYPRSGARLPGSSANRRSWVLAVWPGDGEADVTLRATGR
jgi:hypothetical protein